MLAQFEEIEVRRIWQVALLVSSGMALGVSVAAYGQTELARCPISASSSGDTAPPMLLKRVDPQYPQVAATEQVSGFVMMEFVIAADGSVHDVKVTHGLPQLIPNAVDSMKKWQFRAARVGGVAIACKSSTAMSFRMLSGTAEVAMTNNMQINPSDLFPVRPALPPLPAGVLRVSSKAMESQIEKRVEPVYPSQAEELNARAVVYVLLTVSKSGEVSNAQVLAGFDWFRDPALKAVKQWKFKPYETDGETREVQTMVTLNFAPLK